MVLWDKRLTAVAWHLIASTDWHRVNVIATVIQPCRAHPVRVRGVHNVFVCLSILDIVNQLKLVSSTSNICIVSDCRVFKYWYTRLRANNTKTGRSEPGSETGWQNEELRVCANEQKSHFDILRRIVYSRSIAQYTRSGHTCARCDYRPDTQPALQWKSTRLDKTTSQRTR